MKIREAQFNNAFDKVRTLNVGVVLIVEGATCDGEVWDGRIVDPNSRQVITKPWKELVSKGPILDKVEHLVTIKAKVVAKNVAPGDA